MALLLGLDFGTGGLRLGVFDLSSRRMLGEREEAYATAYPHPGWAEQSPADWWQALGRASRGLMAELGRPEIKAICVATTASTVVACRSDGMPLCPALLWMDCRAAAEAERSAASRNSVMAYVGGSNASEWLISKAMWLKEHEPKLYAGADIICECLDYVNFLLSGRWVGSRMNATCKWNYDSIERRCPSELYEELGVPGLEAKLPPEILPVGGAIGALTTAAAEHLGLGNRPLLVQGGRVALDPAREGFNTAASIWRPTRQVAFGTLAGQPTIAFLEHGSPEAFAAALAKAGVRDAVRLDSGSSATAFVTGGYANLGGYLNTVWSRPVPNAIVLVPRADASPAARR